MELGVDGTLLSGKNHGQDKPVADNATEEGKVLNRPMEFAAFR